jgi:type VI secretion system protein ImpM
MKRAPQQVRIGYFGKLPSRGDFIKSAEHVALLNLLDRWLAGVMNVLTAEPRWKRHYDALQPLDFAFVGTRSRRAIAGRIVASGDQSQRRFPFLTVGAVDIDDPAAFVPRSPLVLGDLWRHLAVLSDAVTAQSDPAPALQALVAASVAVEPEGAVHDADFAAFLGAQTVASLETMLAAAGFAGPVRLLLPAVGMLLRPVRDRAGASLEKSLLLPLARPPRERILLASFWLRLIVPFFAAADVELALFLVDADDGPALVVGFNGADTQALRAVIDPGAAADHQIDFSQMAWVEEQLGDDHAARQFCVRLAQPQLSLRSACTLFHTTFA